LWKRERARKAGEIERRRGSEEKEIGGNGGSGRKYVMRCCARRKYKWRRTRLGLSIGKESRSLMELGGKQGANGVRYISAAFEWNKKS